MTNAKDWGLDWRALLAERTSRKMDADVRRTMGLRFVGLLYLTDSWRTAPVELYQACDGREYLKRGPGTYQRRANHA